MISFSFEFVSSSRESKKAKGHFFMFTEDTVT